MSLLPASVFLGVVLAAHGPEESMGRAFAKALQSDDVREVAALAAQDLSLPTLAWSSVREVTERFDCIEVSSVSTRTGGTPAVIELDLVATGTRANATRRREALPARWVLHVDPQSSVLTAAATSGTQLLRALLASTDDAGDTRVLRAASLPDLREAARALAFADECQGHDDACSRTARAMVFETSARRDSMATAYAISAIRSSLEGDALETWCGDARQCAKRSGNADTIAETTFLESRRVEDAVRQDELDAAVAETAAALDDPRVAMLAVVELGNRSFARYDLPGAFRRYEEASSLARTYGWRRGEMLAVRGKARAVAAMADYAAVNELAMETERLAAELLDHETQARAMNLRAQVALRQRSYTEALTIAGSALDITPPAALEMRSILHTNLAVALEELGRTREASEYIERAVAEGQASNSVYLATTLNIASHKREREGRFHDAIALSQAAIRVQSPHQLWVTSWTKAVIARLQMACGDRNAAIETLFEAVDLIEARRRLTPAQPLARARMFSEHAWVYAMLTDALVSGERHEEALIVSERMRARVLEDRLLIGSQTYDDLDAGRHRLLNEAIIDLNWRLITAVREDEETVRRELHEARTALEAFETQASLRSSPHAAVSHDPASLFDALPNDPRYAAIEYVRHDSDGQLGGLGHVSAIVVRQGQVTGVRLSMNGSAIDRRAEELANRLSSRAVRYSEQSRALYDALMAPLLPHLEGVTHLTIIPTNGLWNVPFEVLLSPSARLIEDDYVVSYAPSLAVLDRASTRDRVPPRRELFALADPSLAERVSAHPASLAALPEAAMEARAAATLYDPNRSRVYLGERANESVFKAEASDYRVVHIGAHSFADKNTPLYSAFLLSPSPSDDGFLEAREIASLSLSSEVAVLAGCDTGGTEAFFSEGAVSLAWAFLAAGSRTVVMSRWRAESEVTAALMIRFHEGLRDGMRPAEALRSARASIRAQPRYRHPFYWAVFGVLGRP